MQTSNGATNLCSCYHDESLHQFPPMPDAPNHQACHSQVPIPLGHAPPLLPPPARLTIPATAAAHPNYGVPSNQATSILRAFHPYQSHPSSTSEENRQMSAARKTNKKKKTQAAKAREALRSPEPIDTDVSIILFPLSVKIFCLRQPSARTFLIPCQVSQLPSSLGCYGKSPEFSMDSGSFGAFAQRMFDLGLVFDVRFTKDEIEQLPSWRLFDRKIMDGVSSLPGKIELPPRPLTTSESVNGTLWAFVDCMAKTVRKQPGRQKYHLVPPKKPTPTARWTLDVLLKEFSVPNPISGLDDNPVPQSLIIIGPSP
jgi:hypothetical protein